MKALPDMPPDVRAAFGTFPEDVRPPLEALRALIFDVATQNARVGRVTETLKWGQPSYLTSKPKSGTTVRLGVTKDNRFGLYVPCSTSLIADFRAEHGQGLTFDGTRGLLFSDGDEISDPRLPLFISRAMTYHLKG